MKLLGLCASVLGAWMMASCNVDPYPLTHSGDGANGDGPDGGASGDGGNGRVDAQIFDGRPDSAPDACVPVGEICNDRDDDCDGEVDEGVETLDRDPNNCGECGMRCNRPNTEGTCMDSQCHFECRPCFFDRDGTGDGTDANGCEYSCCPTNGGIEECDGVDNDCDTLIDEDFNLDDDPEHCGTCNHVCTALHAPALCVDGACTRGACEAGFEDILPGVPGCEYQCPDPARPAETCDGSDEDCDGVIDDGNPGGGANCGTDAGICEFGTTTCLFGATACIGGVPPATVDPCDNIDNDCDGTVDEGFSKMTDPLHCGPTCVVCNLPNAIEGCSGGVCTVTGCLAGWRNTNGNPADGCEHRCTPTGPEVCDGVDNDCDTLIDNADPDLPASRPANFCQQAGACAGTQPTCGVTTCDPDPKWRCVYGGASEHDSCGRLVAQEQICDDLDGDCDGFPDDGFLLKGTPCDDGDLGVCRGTGTYICNVAGDDLTCNITSAGASPTAEICDGLDQDCDGTLDEGSPVQSVHIVGGGMDYHIFRYEASRPNATGSLPGNMEHRPCSETGRLPWASATWTEATAACAAVGSGWRLCSQAEWQRACEGPSNVTYPYGNAYVDDACNGEDQDIDCSMPDEDEVLSTGTLYGCPRSGPTAVCGSAEGVVDLSGNLKEWTATQVSTSPVAYRIRGGAYDSIAAGLTCDFDFVAGEPTYYFPNLGFRCCRTGP